MGLKVADVLQVNSALEVEAPQDRGYRKFIWAALVIGAITHGYHLFRYPLYLTDEGIYTEQAWSVMTHGKLSPYVYFYDHSPFGWLVMALYTRLLPGGFNLFGNPINTERVLMVIVHLASVFFLFEIVRRFSKSVPAAFLATALFNISPLAIYYQRQVLLDNLMMFWVLLALYMLARRDGRVLTAMLAGLAFGLAIVTKENAIFLLPGFWYLMPRTLHGQVNRSFSSIYWWFAAVTPGAVYVLFSVIKSEFLPAGFSLDGSAPVEHVSLVNTIWWQLHRTVASGGAGSVLADLLGKSWLVKDKYFLLAGAVALVVTFLVSAKKETRNVPLMASGILAAGYSFYLARSVLLDFYVVPLVVLVSLNIGLLYAHITESMKPKVRWGVVTA